MKHFILILTAKIPLFALVFIPIWICFSCNSNSSNLDKQKEDLNTITNPTNQVINSNSLDSTKIDLKTEEKEDKNDPYAIIVKLGCK